MDLISPLGRPARSRADVARSVGDCAGRRRRSHVAAAHSKSPSDVTVALSKARSLTKGVGTSWAPTGEGTDISNNTPPAAAAFTKRSRPVRDNRMTRPECKSSTVRVGVSSDEPSATNAAACRPSPATGRSSATAAHRQRCAGDCRLVSRAFDCWWSAQLPRLVVGRERWNPSHV